MRPADDKLSLQSVKVGLVETFIQQVKETSTGSQIRVVQSSSQAGQGVIPFMPIVR